MNERLYRSRDDRMLAGVAGGLAEMWDADPSLVRIIWALVAFLTGGLALVVYIVMAIVVPEGDAGPNHAATTEARAVRRAARGDGTGIGASGAMIGGILLIAVGGFFLIREFLPDIDFDWLWPVALIGLGVVLLVFALGRKPKDPGSAT